MADAKPKVFISYSHKDRDLLEHLRAQLDSLARADLLDLWDDSRIDAGDTWYPEIVAAMEKATVAVCLISANFLASRFCTEREVPFLLERAEKDGLLLIPVVLSDCIWWAHRWIDERQLIPNKPLSVCTHYAGNPAAVFAQVAGRIFQKLTDPNYRPPTVATPWPQMQSGHVNLTRLPETGGALFGREAELTLLDEAWTAAGDGKPERARVLAFTANGGVGKSTLVNRWLSDMERDRFRGADRVFGWSFYSQGVRDVGTASADAFIEAALLFFGDAHPDGGSPWAR